MSRPTPAKAQQALLFVFLSLITALWGPTESRATPHRYTLDASGSTVGFSWTFGPDQVTGSMPVAGADIRIDFDRLQDSTVNVQVDVAGAQAGFPFADQAMRGPKMLDAANHPQITFQSRRITPTARGADIQGDLTIRGVTHAATLTAELFRQSGSAPADLDHLVIVLAGHVNRMEFGADGWADMVGPDVGLDIRARISRVD